MKSDEALTEYQPILESCELNFYRETLTIQGSDYG